MPYIAGKERADYEVEIKSIVDKLLSQDENNVVGHLNYIIFSILKRYVVARGIRYFRVNNLMGMLECCKNEFYRRIIAPYEDGVIGKNGDV